MQNKKLFKLAQMQTFQLKVGVHVEKKSRIFRRKIYADTLENAHCVRNAKYFYCSSKDEAIDLYKRLYGLNRNKDISLGCSDWITNSDNLNEFTSKSCESTKKVQCYPIAASLVECEIIELALTGYEFIKEIKDNMSDSQYANWSMDFKKSKAK